MNSLEKLQLYNESLDSIDEYIYRKDVKTLVEKKYYKIVLMIIEDVDGKYILEIPSKEKGVLFTLPGGHVMYKEDSLDACIREVEEEIGLSIDKNSVYNVDTIKGKRVLLDVYYSKLKNKFNKFDIQKEEVEDIKFLSIDDIKKLIKDDLLGNTSVAAFDLLSEHVIK